MRAKNVKNILLKNVIDVCIGALAWWAVGFAFAFGECGENGFIGHANFFTSESENQVRPALRARAPRLLCDVPAQGANSTARAAGLRAAPPSLTAHGSRSRARARAPHAHARRARFGRAGSSRGRFRRRRRRS